MEYTYTLDIINEDTFMGEAVDFNIKAIDREKYINVELCTLRYIRIFGIIKDLNGCLIKNKNITIHKIKALNSEVDYTVICETSTDEFGVYQAITDKIYSEDEYIIKINRDI